MATLPKRKLIPLWQALAVAKGINSDESLVGSRYAIMTNLVIRFSPAMYKLLGSEAGENNKKVIDNLLKTIQVLVDERYSKMFQ